MRISTPTPSKGLYKESASYGVLRNEQRGTRGDFAVNNFEYIDGTNILFIEDSGFFKLLTS